MKLNYNHKRADWSAIQLRADAHRYTTDVVQYSMQWATALTEAAVMTGIPARALDDEVWSQFPVGQDVDKSVGVRKQILAQVVAMLNAAL